MDYALRQVTPNESAATIANMKAALEKLRPKVGAVKLLVEPGASISPDGTHLEYDPQVEIFVEPGPHVFEARSGGRTGSQTVQAEAGVSRTLTLELTEPPMTPAAAYSPPLSPPSDARHGTSSARTVALFVGGALTVGGLGTGIGWHLVQFVRARCQDYRARLARAGCASGSASADCASLQEAVDGQRRKTQIANVGYGVAAAGLITVGVALLWPRSDQEKRAQTSAVELRWSGDAVFLDGKF